MDSQISALSNVLINGQSIVSTDCHQSQELIPHRQLLTQVFLKAIDDLKGNNLKYQYSAAEFLAGPVAEEYVGHLGLPEWMPKLALLIHAQCELRTCLEIPDQLKPTLSHYAPLGECEHAASL
ncbi:hypothetical protein AAG587_17615 [Vreelandella neptunia]|uniref:hypothetical protein n=1 Tax=Vreelandella neptunia TaxID=115551 RepID=UPI003159F87D